MAEETPPVEAVTTTPPPATEAPPQDLDRAAAEAAAEAKRLEDVAAAAAEKLKRAKSKQAATARAALLDEQRAEVEAMRKLREAQEEELDVLRTDRAARESAARLARLRTMGAKSLLSDKHLLDLAPEVDPSTSDGIAALDKWRDANAQLFEVREMTSQAVGDALIADMPKPKPDQQIFGEAFAERMIKRVMGGGS